MHLFLHKFTKKEGPNELSIESDLWSRIPYFNVDGEIPFWMKYLNIYSSTSTPNAEWKLLTTLTMDLIARPSLRMTGFRNQFAERAHGW